MFFICFSLPSIYISKDRNTYIYYSPKGRWVCDQSSVMYLLFFQVQNQHIRVSGCVTNPVLYVPAILSYQKYTISTTFQVQNQQRNTSSPSRSQVNHLFNKICGKYTSTNWKRSFNIM